MKVMFCGSRKIYSLRDTEYVKMAIAQELNKLPSHTTILHGGAMGVDHLTNIIAKSRNFNIKVFYPDYKNYGKYAPIKRNQEMVDQADRIIAVWDGLSPGTQFVIGYAKKKHKKIRVILWET